MDYLRSVENIRHELKTYIQDNGIKSLVMGISGGVDSTLCALLAKPVCDELGIPLIGRSLPAKSNSKGENSRAKEIGELFCTDFKETSINSCVTSLIDKVFNNYNVYPEPYATEEGYKFNILKGNTKARIRMTLLYDIAGATNGLVLSTDNWTEYLLGFWTLHGDVGDYGMIQNLWKTEVYEMTEWIRMNELTDEDEQDAIVKVIFADATDGLGISQTDLEQILPSWEGSSREGYEKVDIALNMWTQRHDFSPEQREEVESKFSDSPVIQRHERTEFKRKNPVNIPRNRIT